MGYNATMLWRRLRTWWRGAPERNWSDYDPTVPHEPSEPYPDRFRAPAPRAGAVDDNRAESER